MRIARAGLVYFALVFAAGFVLGPLREWLVVPLVGRTGGVLVEAPLMIAAMGAAAVWTAGHFAIPGDHRARLAMGFTGFATLMLAEAALAGPVRGWTLAQWLGHFATGEGLVSLALYLLFAVMPMLVQRVEMRRSEPPT